MNIRIIVCVVTVCGNAWFSGLPMSVCWVSITSALTACNEDLRVERFFSLSLEWVIVYLFEYIQGPAQKVLLIFHKYL